MSRRDLAAVARLREQSRLDRQAERLMLAHEWGREALPGSAGGRALPATPTALRARAASDPVSVVRGTVAVEHVTLLSTFNQQIPSGGGDLTFEWWSEAAPNQRRGYTSLAAGGAPVTEVPVNLTGVLKFRLKGTWGEEQESGDTIEVGRWWRESGPIVVTLRRDGIPVGSRTYPAGRVVSSSYLVNDSGWEVVAGDTLTFTMPNSSGEAQRHRQAELHMQVIELERNTVAVGSIAEVVDWKQGNSGSASGTVVKPDNVVAGDLLLAFGAQRDIGTTGMTIAEFAAVTDVQNLANLSIVAYAKTATASEPASYAYSFQGGGAAGTVVHMVRVPQAAVAVADSDQGVEPWGTPGVGTIQPGQVIVGITGRTSVTPATALPDAPVTLLNDYTLINVVVSVWWDGTAGTSVRTVDQGSASASAAVVRCQST